MSAITPEMLFHELNGHMDASFAVIDFALPNLEDSRPGPDPVMVLV